MAANLHEISILGLHRVMDIKIPIANNRLILVGVNGIGKTTVVNILYYVLSRQWHRLADFTFEEIIIRLGRNKISVKPNMLIPSEATVKWLERSLPPSIRRRAAGNPRFRYLLTQADFRRLEEEFNVPRDYFDRRFGGSKSFPFQPQLFDGDEASPLSKVETTLSDLIESQILYLPTYRRIEHDLGTLLPHFTEDIREVVTRQLRRQNRERSFVELVQFGMEDVHTRIVERINKLKEQARLELNGLAGSYLRDVIRGDAERYRRDDIAALDEGELDHILARVEERTLPERDKIQLRKVIGDIRDAESQQESTRERYLAHFCSKLVEIRRSQQQREAPLREFTRVCNAYLEGKEITFDDIEYDMSVVSSHGFDIHMGQLSSGEKQIVSLFSHIFLGLSKSFFVIIDEPELSLSVDWQMRLLPDLAQSKRCDYLVAVTHSPFVYDNELEEHAVDLRAHTKFR